MLQISICDDEPVFLDLIEDLIDSVLQDKPFHYSVDSFRSGEELCDELDKGALYDIIFLDISMQGMSGIDVARRLRTHFHNIKTVLIYISFYENRAKEVFCFNTFRFLSKPIDPVLFKEYLLDACEFLKEQRDRFYSFKDIAKGMCALPVDDIIYFANKGNHRINIVTKEETYTFYGKLTELQEELQFHKFLLIHHSFLINFTHIKQITYVRVCMSNQTELVISGPKRKDIRRRYSQLLTEIREGRAKW